MKNASRILTLALAVLLLAAPAWAQSGLQDLERVGRQLMGRERPGAMLAYLREYHPEFYEAADRAGLSRYLDGEITRQAFEAELERGLSGAANADALRASARTLGELVDARPGGTRAGPSATSVRGATPGEVSELLRPQLYDADRHWLTETWSDSLRGSVGVRFVPGELAWFNPNVSIPELGIRAGEPLTDAQRSALVSMLSIETVPAGEGAQGRGSFPSHVGRSLNPNSNTLTVINDRGEVINDLVIKGAGPNVPNATRDGRLAASEAFLDAEVTRNIYRAGVSNYDVLAVILPENVADKAILVRAPRSLMRHNDMDKLQGEELRESIDRVLRDMSLREGRQIDLKEYLRSELPRMTGEGAGRLGGLGVYHGSLSMRDNHGLGETVDWGNVGLGDPHESQKATFWGEVEKTVGKLNALLPEGERVDVAEARTAFEAAYARGESAVANERIRFSPTIVERMSDADIRSIVRRSLDNVPYDADRDVLLEALASSNRVEGVSPPAGGATAGLPLPSQRLSRSFWDRLVFGPDRLLTGSVDADGTVPSHRRTSRRSWSSILRRTITRRFNGRYAGAPTRDGRPVAPPRAGTIGLTGRIGGTTLRRGSTRATERNRGRSRIR